MQLNELLEKLQKAADEGHGERQVIFANEGHEISWSIESVEQRFSRFVILHPLPSDVVTANYESSVAVGKAQEVGLFL